MRSNWLTNLKYFQAISFVTVAWVVTVSSAHAQVADENGIYINKRPLKDWSKRFSEEVISKRIDLNSQFTVSISGTLGLGSDGKTVVLQHPKRLPSTQPAGGDPEMVKLVEDALMAAGDAGWFGYFDALSKGNNPKAISFVVRQDTTDFSVDINYSLASVNQARTMASSLSMMVQIGQIKAPRAEDRLLLSNTKVSSDDSVLKIQYSSAKSEFWKMIRQKVSSIEGTKSAI